MVDISEYINLVETYEWSDEIEYLVMTVKLEKRVSVMICNAIRQEGYKVELHTNEGMQVMFGNYFFNIKVHKKNIF